MLENKPIKISEHRNNSHSTFWIEKYGFLTKTVHVLNKPSEITLGRNSCPHSYLPKDHV